MSLLKTKEDLRDEFNVSTATINNWIKTGIIPAPQNNNSYSIEEFEQIKEFLNQSSIKLKKRANRSKTDEKSVCFLGIENDYRKKQLLEAIKLHNKYKYSVEHSVLALSIVQLQSVFLLKTDWNEKPTTALEYFICKWMRECDFDISQCGCFSDNLDIPNINDDFIGAFYQSVQGIAEKSKTGSYYTPRRLLDGISVPNNKTVLDPCCGSGGILMKILTPARNTKLIYARDIDILALKICRVNLSMFFMNPDIAANIELHNILFEKVCGSPDSIDCGAGKKKFDYIATNPPWGSKFTSSEKEKILKSYSFLNTAESFSIALYNSINSLSEENGRLIFFLPHSFLNVSTHKNIRKFLMEKKCEIKIKLLGNAFSGVMSESIRLELNAGVKSESIKIIFPDKTVSEIDYSEIHAPDYIIPSTADSCDIKLLNKIYSNKNINLKGKSIFALGIVTGNNSAHISDKFIEGSVPVFRGKDIEPFKFNEPKCFIKFSPDVYQQVAPVEYYRQRKIAYRFISDKIICALDNRNRLLLNSSNLFIPQIGYPFETIVCLFNSKLYSYIYRKKFHSKKVLRSHIESLPIPLIAKEQHQWFRGFHGKILSNKINIDKLDKFVYSIFNLTEREINTIEEFMS